jgi:hypothetical protein
VDPVPEQLLLRKPGSAGNRTRTSGYVTTRPQRLFNEVEAEVNLRPTVSLPVCLDVRLSSGAHDQILFSV